MSLQEKFAVYCGCVIKIKSSIQIIEIELFCDSQEKIKKGIELYKKEVYNIKT